MDPSTIWQWRVKFVKMYSRHPTPFFYCDKIGLDFNVGSSKNKKLDLQSATNGVVLEICEFAKTLNKNRYRFISHILENSFDLGLENEQQRRVFSLKIGPKIRDLKKKRPKSKMNHFNLTTFLSACKRYADGSEHPNTDRVSVEMVVPNADDSEHEEELNSSQAPSDEYVKIEYVSDEMDETHSDVSERDPHVEDNEHEEEFSSSQGPSEENEKTEHVSQVMDETHTVSGHEHQFTCSGDLSAKELKEGLLPLLFPMCEQIGVNFEVGSSQHLHPALVTPAVMLELAQVTRILTGSFVHIVLGVLDHNFEINLEIQGRQIFSKVLRLLERYKKLAPANSKVRAEFEHEPFSLSLKVNPSKKVRGSKLFNKSSSQYHLKEVAKRRQSELKRKREEMSVFPTSDLWTSPSREDDRSFTCPLGESDADSDEDVISVKIGDQERNRERCSLSPNKVRDLESRPLSERFPPINPNVDSSESDSDKEQLFAGRPQTPTRTNDDVLTESDREQGALGTDKLWKLRANRVKQILTMLDKDSFFMSKRFGLNYNVGFGLKQQLDIETMNQSALFEVVKFALALNSSQQDFIMEILEYNFDLGLQGEQQRQMFASETMKRVRQLKNCEYVAKFSKETFELPDPESLMNMTNHSLVGVKPELITVPVRPPDSHAEPEEHVSESSEVLYPHCKEMGLKLHLNNNQANTKLNISKLTKGAMIEVGKFAEMLCGTFKQVLFDVIEHNFDVDLQGGHSEVAANILTQIAHIVDRRNLPIFKPLNTGLGKSCIQKCPNADSSGVTEQECHSSSNSEECSAGTSQTPVADQHVGGSADRKELNDYDKMMWKLRANHIQHMLTIPHVDDCPLYSYSRCKKIGLDFNVGSGVKQNLDPNLLTNGVMAEVSAFAAELQAAQKYFITEILEYNFGLILRNEQYRQVFAAVTFKSFRQLTKYRFKASRLQSLFTLPFGKCVKIADSKSPSCPKCHQERNYKLGKEDSDPDHMQHRPQSMTETVLDDPNSASQTPEMNRTFSFSTTEETIMQSYPRCKKIGLKLCVHKNKPAKKLGMHLLTVETMIEVADFAKKLCGVLKHDLIGDILEQNFSVNIPSRKNLPEQFMKATKQYDGWAAWFSQVFVIQPSFQIDRIPARKQAAVAGSRKSERSKEAEKRQLELQQTTAEVAVTTENSPAEPKKKNLKSRQLQQYDFPFCKKIGLDLDVKSKSGIPKNKLKLNVLTRAVVWEICKFANRRVKYSPFSQTVYEILDYNFDISSQHCRRWEFSEAAASKVQKIAKQFKNNPQRGDAVFKLPFVIEPSSSQNVGGQRKKKNAQRYLSKSDPRCNQPGGNVQLTGYSPDANWGTFFHGVQTEKDLLFHHEDTKPASQTGSRYPAVVGAAPGHEALTQVNGSAVAAGGDSPVQGNESFIARVKEEDYDAHYDNMEPEADSKEKEVKALDMKV